MTKKKDVLNTITVEQRLGCGNLHLEIRYSGEELTVGGLDSLSATAGRNGSCVRLQTMMYAEIITVVLEHPDREDALKRIIGAMKGQGCVNVQEFVGNEKKNKLSCADGFAKVLGGQLFPRGK